MVYSELMGVGFPAASTWVERENLDGNAEIAPASRVTAGHGAGAIMLSWA
jgi:hypothetical protein